MSETINNIADARHMIFPQYMSSKICINPSFLRYYSGGKNERAESKLLAFHEFLFNRLHIHRGDMKLSEVFMGASKFRILTRKPNISRKY